MSCEFKLPGIHSYNLLGFLSILGLLKILEESKPEWKPRIKWINQVPSLRISEDTNKKQIVEITINGLKNFNKFLKFDDYKNIPESILEFKKFQTKLDPDIAALFGSDGSLYREKTMVEKTPLCLINGAGHQNFLERLGHATTIQDEDYNKITKHIENALFEEWNYESDVYKTSFRWSPKEKVEHAYMGTDPKKTDTLTCDGANRLASVGFTTYICVPTTDGLNTMAYDKKNEKIMWPIWNIWLSLPAILFIMQHPHMTKISNNIKKTDLQTYGVEYVMATKVSKTGDRFKNVTNAEFCHTGKRKEKS